MGLFYAYLRVSWKDGIWRYIITFADRETADEWWRSISAPSSPFVSHVQRISPQLYYQDDMPSDNVAGARSPDLPYAKSLGRKMFFSSLRKAGNFLTIRPVIITDHISGGWYFIRSKVDPWSCWYHRTDGTCLVCGDATCDAVHVSSEYRTKFCVRVRPSDDVQVPEDFVMIGMDEILITAPMGRNVHINEAGELKAIAGYQGETELLFSDLKKRFITRAKKQVNGEVWEYVVPVERGSGEVWELVD